MDKQGLVRVSTAFRLGVAVLLALAGASGTSAADVKPSYYAHPAVHDEHGVIAPWYKGQNGQVDFRLRIAAETLKRYPWVEPPAAVSAAPYYVFNGHWKIDPDGTITPRPIPDWDNGDLGQRAATILSAMVEYYRYTGDPAAVAIMAVQADALLDHALTPADHPWPNFPISVPVAGKPYGKADPRGMIQLDIAAEAGAALLRAYQVVGEPRWFEAAKHWGDVLAAKRDRTPGAAPWGRYANPENVRWKDVQQTGGVVYLLEFFDELIRLGYTGDDGAIVQARDAGRAYLRDTLLPIWTVNDTLGRNYWDWNDPVQAENVTEFCARYMMNNPDVFPNWRNDVRNVLSLFLNHTGVDPASGGEVHSGAWAFPESSVCCGRSLWYGPMELASPFAQYGVRTGSAWARELARRMQILATYDGHDTGVSEDDIDGGFIVNADWFKIAHPMPLLYLAKTIAWLPETFGPARENHVVRSSAIVRKVSHGPRGVSYQTFDAPAPTVDVLRLAFLPETVAIGDGAALSKRETLDANGYTVKPLPGGDYVVEIRHDGIRDVTVSGPSPEHVAGWNDLTRAGTWIGDAAADVRYSEEAGAAVEFAFTGNRVRLTGRALPDGGLAEVYLDGVKQLVGVDCWRPRSDAVDRGSAPLYERNGLANGPHTLKLVALGKKNPLSEGNRVYVDGAEWSDAEGVADTGAGGGPTDAQRMVFGYTGREDVRDSAGGLWRPGTEFVVRLGAGADSVAASWWTEPTATAIEGTADPELYRRGVHAKDFTVNVTVGPGKYHVRLKFAAGRIPSPPQGGGMTVAINGEEVARDLDVAAAAGGPDRAFDLVFDDLAPKNGVIAVRFQGSDAAHAFVQAIEVGPGPGGEGTTPVTGGKP